MGQFNSDSKLMSAGGVRMQFFQPRLYPSGALQTFSLKQGSISTSLHVVTNAGLQNVCAHLGRLMSVAWCRYRGLVPAAFFLPNDLDIIHFLTTFACVPAQYPILPLNPPQRWLIWSPTRKVQEQDFQRIPVCTWRASTTSPLVTVAWYTPSAFS